MASASRALVLQITILSDRWHGRGDWPPSPFRVFQALVAGAYTGRWRGEPPDEKDRTFRWLEALQPPLILAPARRMLRPVTYFVPNNDLDAVGNDPRRVAEIRVEKRSQTSLLDGTTITYVWDFSQGEEHADHVLRICERLHTFGRGIDAAFATGRIAGNDEIEEILSHHRGQVSRPAVAAAGGSGGDTLPCSIPGSLASLKARFAANNARYIAYGKRTSFARAPVALSRPVSYDSPTRALLFELRVLGGDRPFAALRPETAVDVVKAVRDLTLERLQRSSGDREVLERVVLGRGSAGGERKRRLRFLALPSIGSAFADYCIRRVAVEIPPSFPLPEADVRWALSGQVLPGFGTVDESTGEVTGVQLVETNERKMLRHYEAAWQKATVWESVTPVVLPVRRPSGRIGGASRSDAVAGGAAAVLDALRHAGVFVRASAVRVQAEPFSPRGSRTDAFNADRFGSRRLYHVQIEFAEPVAGPLILGDGRWLGLGLMRPLWSTNTPAAASEARDRPPDSGIGDDDDDSASDIDLEIDDVT